MRLRYAPDAAVCVPYRVFLYLRSATVCTRFTTVPITMPIIVLTAVREFLRLRMHVARTFIRYDSSRLRYSLFVRVAFSIHCVPFQTLLLIPSYYVVWFHFS